MYAWSWKPVRACNHGRETAKTSINNKMMCVHQRIENTTTRHTHTLTHLRAMVLAHAEDDGVPNDRPAHSRCMCTCAICACGARV